jgi:hypothetical protein
MLKVQNNWKGGAAEAGRRVSGETRVLAPVSFFLLLPFPFLAPHLNEAEAPDQARDHGEDQAWDQGELQPEGILTPVIRAPVGLSVSNHVDDG